MNNSKQREGSVASLHENGFPFRVFFLSSYDEKIWTPAGHLIMFSITAFLNGEKLSDVHHHAGWSALVFRYVKDTKHPIGKFFISKGNHAFMGPFIIDDDSMILLRGIIYDSISFQTKRRLAGSIDEYKDWIEFEIEWEWEKTVSLFGKSCEVIYYLGDEIISKNTRITNVDELTGVITIEMKADSIDAAEGNRDSFNIQVAADATSFQGVYVDKDGRSYDWTGVISNKSKVQNDSSASDFLSFFRY